VLISCVEREIWLCSLVRKRERELEKKKNSHGFGFEKKYIQIIVQHTRCLSDVC
jgi:hypothetical protein